MIKDLYKDIKAMDMKGKLLLHMKISVGTYLNETSHLFEGYALGVLEASSGKSVAIQKGK